ncbi:thermonuclease family protein [Pseudooceanicola sp.]|jgi:endonuclease YncB( thermonuclease family)|uniref:thermonuclease family protein n=1 Tax=Pseudooceanicola sp. TaxID=1914328 RepID=UPI004059429B
MARAEIIRLRAKRRRRIAARARGVLLALAFIGLGTAGSSGMKLPALDFLMRGAPPSGRLILQGAATHVRDGDTIEVRGTPVRIANLDCAERGTAAGRDATYRMVELVQHGPLLCHLEGRWSRDREVGTCAIADGRDIGEIMIAEGVCARWRGRGGA